MPPSLLLQTLKAIQSVSSCMKASRSQLVVPICLASTTPNRPSDRSAANPAINASYPPESPKHIRIRHPPQDQDSEKRLPFVKGILPLPRKIFHNLSGPAKFLHAPTEEGIKDYLAKVRPLTAAELRGRVPARTKEQEAKRHATNARRASLASGLKGLLQRKASMAQTDMAIRMRRRVQVLSANREPDRLDEMLTRSSIRAATLITATVPDPHRFARAKQSIRRTKRKEQIRRESRLDALSQLYNASARFMTDEKELEERVEKEFTEDKFSMSAAHGGKSIWATESKPVGMKELMSRAWGGFDGQSFVDANKPRYNRTTKRQKEVSEELTGGKIDTVE